MIWHMFVSKKLSAAAYLMEKVGKAPKDRLCRKVGGMLYMKRRMDLKQSLNTQDVGLSEGSLGKFVKISVDLLKIMMEVCMNTHIPSSTVTTYANYRSRL